MAKQLDLTKILEAIDSLSTEEQLQVKSFTEKTLEEKAKKAEAELSLIKNTK